MNAQFMRNVVGVMVLGLGGLFSQAASAFPCQYGFVGPVNLLGDPTNYSCEDGPAGNNNDTGAGGIAASNLTVFGSNDWEQVGGEFQNGAGGPAGLYDFTSTADTSLTFGTWSYLPSIWDDFAEVMIVLKDGGVPQGDPNAIYWSAYLVTPEDTSGFWNMGTECNGPACNADNPSIPRQISHIALYARGDGGEQPPEPGVPEIDALAGTGALSLLAGAVALAGERRRRKTV